MTLKFIQKFKELRIVKQSRKRRTKLEDSELLVSDLQQSYTMKTVWYWQEAT